QSLSGLRRRLERKKEAGARFLQTQMVMEPTVLEHFCNEVANPLGLPVLAGVFLLKSARNARFINKVVPGASIPESLVARLDQASDPAAEGVAIAAEQVKSYLAVAQGVHLMAVKAEQRIPEILDQAGINLGLV
ncbi:MAG TPA: methylenetetrahydrofolate reductase, partial [Prochlorococcus sp.]